MLDRRVREATGPWWDAAARAVARTGITPDAVTAIGLVVGIAACAAAALAAWWWALGLWLANRIIDGLDGPLARIDGATDRGGFLDILADFAIYGGFVAGVAVALPDARVACAVLLATYYVNGAAFLALSGLLGERGVAVEDERSLRFVGGLAEGTETIIVHSLFCLFPGWAEQIAWAFAVAVASTAIYRTAVGARVLRS